MHVLAFELMLPHARPSCSQLHPLFIIVPEVTWWHAFTMINGLTEGPTPLLWTHLLLRSGAYLLFTQVDEQNPSRQLLDHEQCVMAMVSSIEPSLRFIGLLSLCLNITCVYM